jgi:hypothetical protein
MNADPGQAMQVPAQSDTIPILNAGSVSRTPSVEHDKRGGSQTRKASNIVVQEPGWPSFGPAPAHHRTAAPPAATATGRLDVSHGITRICGNRMGNGNALCRAGKLIEKAKGNRTISISTIPQTQKTFLVRNTRRRGVF